MTVDQHISRIEKENGLVFALKWSLVGVALATCVLASGCGTLFDNGPERYNTVQGPRRTPLLNPGGASQPEQPGQQQPVQNQQLQQPSQQPVGQMPQSSQMPPPVRQPAAPAPQHGAMSQPQQLQQLQMQQQQQAQPQPSASAMPQQPSMPAPAAHSQATVSAQPLPQNRRVQPLSQTSRAAQPANPFAGQPEDSTPNLPPTRQRAPQPSVGSVDDEIAQLEQEFDQSQTKRRELQQAQEEEGWLPRINMDEWMNSDGDEAASEPTNQPPMQSAREPVNVVRSAPQARQSDQHNRGGDAKVVAVPELRMDKHGTQVSYSQADSYAPPQATREPAAASQPARQQPGAQSASPEAPVPPMISEPAPQPTAQTAWQSSPAEQAPQSLNVPNPPSVRPAPQALSPEGLVPPQPAYSQSQERYLDQSRYAGRRGQGYPGAY